MISTELRNEAYASIQDKLPEKRRKVYTAILEGHNTALDIAQFYKIPINEVTGRISELKESLWIKEIGVKENKRTGQKVTAYAPTTELERETMKANLIIDLEGAIDLLKDDIQRVSGLSKVLLQKELFKLKNRLNRLK